MAEKTLDGYGWYFNTTGMTEFMADPDLDVPALIDATVPVLAVRHLRAAVEAETIP